MQVMERKYSAFFFTRVESIRRVSRHIETHVLLLQLSYFDSEQLVYNANKYIMQ